MAFGLALLLLTCKKDGEIYLQSNQQPPVYTNGEGLIGPAGGTITVDDETSPLKGITIDIPEDALNEAVMIKLEIAPDSIKLPTDPDALVIKLSPAGLQFDAPVEITFPLLQGIDTTWITGYHIDPVNMVIKQIPCEVEENIVLLETDHFSYFVISDRGIRLYKEMFYYDSPLGKRVSANIWIEGPINGTNNWGLEGIPVPRSGYDNVLQAVNDYHSNHYFRSVFNARLKKRRTLWPNANIGESIEVSVITKLTHDNSHKVDVIAKRDNGTILAHNSNIEITSEHQRELFFGGRALCFNWFETLEDNGQYSLLADFRLVNINGVIYTFRNEFNTRRISLKPAEMQQINPDANYNFIMDNLPGSGTKPTVNTSPVSNITQTSVTAGGNVTNQGSAPVTAHGLVWSLQENPTLENHLGAMVIGTGTGPFSGSITNLTPNTTYYVRAYATNSAGTAYGSQVSFTTLSGTGQAPTVSTLNITNITQTSASSGGNVTAQGSSAVTARGVVWGTMPNPTITNNEGLTNDGVGTGNFTSNIAGLTSSTNYYVRAYATNSHGTGYGQVLQFTTLPIAGDPPAVPTNVYAGDWNQGFGVYWNDNSINETGFRIYKATNSLVNLQEYGTAPANSTFFADNQNNPDNFYAYQVTAFNNDGESEMSTMAVVPKRPINLAGQAGPFKITVSWEYPANSQAQRVYVHRSTSPDGVFTPIGYVNYPTTSIEHTDVETGVNYYYKAHSGNSSNADHLCKSLPTNVIGPFMISGIGGGVPCPGTPTVTDIDGNVYNTVLIGGQCWMKENLNVTRDAAGNHIQRHCYNVNPQNCNLTGGLYYWHVAMNGQSSSNSNPSSVQGICPTGWHLPSTAEWTQLVDYVDAQGFLNGDISNGAGNALKSCRQINSPLGGECDTNAFPRWNSNGTHYGFDEFGFSAHAGGYGWGTGLFSSRGESGMWWSTTETSSSTAFISFMRNDRGYINQSENGNKLNKYSVRCLRD